MPTGRRQSLCHPHQEAGMSRQRLPPGKNMPTGHLSARKHLPASLAAASAPRPPGPRAAGGGDQGRNDSPWLEPSARCSPSSHLGSHWRLEGTPHELDSFPTAPRGCVWGPLLPSLPGARHPFVPPSAVSAASGWQCGRAHRPPAGQLPRPRAARIRAQRRGPASVQPEKRGPPAARPLLLLRRWGAAPSLAKPGA